MLFRAKEFEKNERERALELTKDVLISGERSEAAVELLSWLVGWLVVLGFNATLTVKVISWQSVIQTH